MNRRQQDAFENRWRPAQLDNDPAVNEPNYLGYVMSMLPAALIALLALVAIVLTV